VRHAYVLVMARRRSVSIEAAGVDQEGETIGEGRPVHSSRRAPARGSTLFCCSVPEHPWDGMEGTLTVR
jgi:hypothetical protein